MVSQKKEKIVQDLSQTLNNSKNFVLVKFDKTTHQALEDLRKNLRKSLASLKVVKNTLFEKSIKKIRSSNQLYSQFVDSFFPLQDPTALITLGDDWSAGLKTFSDFTQKNQTIKFKFGLLDSQIYTKESLEKIASLPSKDELLAHLASQLKIPITKLVFALRFSAFKLVYLLLQKSNSKN